MFYNIKDNIHHTIREQWLQTRLRNLIPTFTIHTRNIFYPSRQWKDSATFWTKSWITVKHRHLFTYKAPTLTTIATMTEICAGFNFERTVSHVHFYPLPYLPLPLISFLQFSSLSIICHKTGSPLRWGCWVYPQKTFRLADCCGWFYCWKELVPFSIYQCKCKRWQYLWNFSNSARAVECSMSI